MTGVLASRAGRYVILAIAAFAAMVTVVGPDAMAWDGAFIAGPPSFPDAPVPPGDHLRTTYILWLWEMWATGAQSSPFVDPYQFAAAGEATLQPVGWPLSLLFVPVSLLFNVVAAHNFLVIAGFVGSALATYALARRLGAGEAGAWVAGFAYAFAPFRLLEAGQHVNAMLAPLLPLLVLCLDNALFGPRRRAAWTWAAGAVQVSIAASGEQHLAVFSVLLTALFVAGRFVTAPRPTIRPILLPAVAMVGGVAAVAAAQFFVFIKPSAVGGGRGVEELLTYAPRLGDLIRRTPVLAPVEAERYIYPGVVILALAVIGAIVGFRGKSQRNAVLTLGTVAALAYAAALIPSLEDHPSIIDAYRAIPFFSFSRTPKRIVILAVLALAVLAAFAFDAVRHRTARNGLAALAIAALLFDAPAGLFSRNGATMAPVASLPAGASVLDLPPFGAGHTSATVGSYFIIGEPGPRVGGYSPYVSPSARDTVNELHQSFRLPLDQCLWQQNLHELDVDYVTVNRSLFGPNAIFAWPFDPELSGARFVDEFRQLPFVSLVSDNDGVAVFAVDRPGPVCDAEKAGS